MSTCRAAAFPCRRLPPSYGFRRGSHHLLSSEPSPNDCVPVFQTMAEERLAGREKRLKSLENELEVRKREHQTETAEYKEQINQHSRTIVDLRSRVVEAVQQAKKVKEDNVKLQKQIEGQKRAQRGGGGGGVVCRLSSAGCVWRTKQMIPISSRAAGELAT